MARIGHPFRNHAPVLFNVNFVVPLAATPTVAKNREVVPKMAMQRVFNPHSIGIAGIVREGSETRAQRARAWRAPSEAHLARDLPYDGHPCPSQRCRATPTREHLLCAEHLAVTAVWKHAFGKTSRRTWMSVVPRCRARLGIAYHQLDRA